MSGCNGPEDLVREGRSQSKMSAWLCFVFSFQALPKIYRLVMIGISMKIFPLTNFDLMICLSNIEHRHFLQPYCRTVDSAFACRRCRNPIPGILFVAWKSRSSHASGQGEAIVKPEHLGLGVGLCWAFWAFPGAIVPGPYHCPALQPGEDAANVTRAADHPTFRVHRFHCLRVPSLPFHIST